MKTNTMPRSILLLAALGLSAAFAACSSEDTNPNPTPVTSSTSGGETTSSVTSSATTGAGGAGSTTTTTSSSASGTGGAGGGGDCFAGTPKTNAEFLNACTTADCGKFTTTLPLLKSDGTLPPLP
jgi:hypothetical protein